jgi:hypothetical protein
MAVSCSRQLMIRATTTAMISMSRIMRMMTLRVMSLRCRTSIIVPCRFQLVSNFLSPKWPLHSHNQEKRPRHSTMWSLLNRMAAVSAANVPIDDDTGGTGSWEGGSTTATASCGYHDRQQWWCSVNAATAASRQYVGEDDDEAKG